MDAAELAQRFALGGDPKLSDGPVARGKQGVVWRLKTVDGRWAVKVPFEQCDEDDVRSATVFQETAHAAGVPTPRVRRTTDGCVLATIGDKQVRVYEWVDLLPPDPGLDPALVGTVVAAIHKTSIPGVGALDPWCTEPVGADRWDQLVERLRTAGAPFASRLADLRDELVALESWIEPPQALRTCHQDLWADNVLPTADGGVCVLDWENSGPADPSHELAYREAGGPAAVNRRGHFSMLIAQLGHITEIAATDWLQPNPRSPDRADSAAWVSEVLDDPHTRERLDSLLAAVAGTANR